MKANLTIILGAVATAIGIWFFSTESSYASTSNSCNNPQEMCLAEVLKYASIGQILSGIAIVLIGMHIKENS